MAKTVVFYMAIESEEDFGKFGNFIYKVLEYKKLNDNECNGIYSIQSSSGMQAKDYCKYVLENRENMRTIRKPEEIQKMGNHLYPKFIMHISENKMPEIVQYKYAMMLEKFFREVDLYCIVQGTQAFYHKLSQYYSYCNLDTKIHDKILYFVSQNEIKKMALSGERSSSAFFALLFVNEETTKKLKIPCLSLLGQHVIENLEKDNRKGLKEEIEWNILEGPIKLWRDNIKNLESVGNVHIIQCLKDMDTLSFILLSYSLKNFAETRERVSFNEFRHYIELIKQYANACYQLLENIVFHSHSKWGLLSVRVHTSEDESIRKYVNEKYCLYAGDNNSYFEIEICDYNGRQNGYNISQNFYNNLPENEREGFQNIQPIDLFRSSLEGSNEMKMSWTTFYMNPENMGKHYGLRIFQRIVSQNQGKFIAESHQEYIAHVGEDYGYGCDLHARDMSFCMPGTAYHIILPLKTLQNRIVEKDISQEYGDWLRINARELMQLKGKEIPVSTLREYMSQEEKNELICEVARQNISNYENIEEQVLFLNMSPYKAEKAEIWAKAVIFALIRMNNRKHIVLYNCVEEFINQIWVVLVELFHNSGMEELFLNSSVQIMLISKELEQTVFVPASMSDTNDVNQYISRVKGIYFDRNILGERYLYNLENGQKLYIPFEMIEVDEKKCFFETYVERILSENIQLDKLGCRIQNTHMRLGSTIHINNFYEAEILFGNKYFITRFAFMIIRDCYSRLQSERKITLYGYASYSEALLVEICNTIKGLIEDIDIDYIVLEREEEKRGFSNVDKVEKDKKILDEQLAMSHTDRIRYNQKFLSLKNREEYIKERKFILIVPINSTLKTHERLISFLKEENAILSTLTDWIMENYAVLLVGSEKQNNYWEEDIIHKKTINSKMIIEPKPKYMVRVDTDYQESLECKMCYPDNPIDELPLIEVNAASTIPNQAFGLVKEIDLDIKKSDVERFIVSEMESLSCLKQHLLYRHTVRNENHYLYYFSTDLLVQSQKGDIEMSLRKWKENYIFKPNEYHIIVAPMHYTNSVFAELVNENVFSGMASILRIDFNKEYRSNVYVKYSNVRQYIKQLNESDSNAKIKFCFVDDSIITGKTYWRAKSLIESLVESYQAEYLSVEIEVFDKIFILIDRNSVDTKMQYISKTEKNKSCINQEYYTYKQIEISSIRTYGDSCVLCNLKKEADLLYNTASTKIVHRYWETSNEKFELKDVEDALIEKNSTDNPRKEERAFRRLFCAHVLKKVLAETEHGNQANNVMIILLNVICVDYKYREKTGGEEAFEYFLSYIKIMSRPFLIFEKAIKEAVFDVLLLIIDKILKNETITKIAEESHKEYLLTAKIQKKLKELEDTILNKLNGSQKKDLVQLLMKQLCELKSNYILRYESMNNLIRFIYEISLEAQCVENKDIIDDFLSNYVVLIKRLTGTSSDTSKSLWIDRKILEKYAEYQRIDERMENYVERFLELLILENTRTISDGIEKLYQKIKYRGEQKELLVKYEDLLLTKEYYRWIYSNILTEEDVNWNEKTEFLDFLEQDSAITYLLKDEPKTLLRKNGDVKVSDLWKNMLNMIEEMNNNVSTYNGDIAEIKRICVEWTSFFEKETAGYQHQNFVRLLSLMGVYDREKRKLTEEGCREIIACVAIKHICDEFDNKDNSQKVWGTIQILIRLFGEILGGIPIQLIMEVEGSSEYYKKVILEAFDYGEAYKKRKGPQLCINKHYEILRDEDNIPGNLTILEKEIGYNMNRGEIMQQLDKYGYVINNKVFVWKLEKAGDFPIYLYAPFRKKISNKDKFRIRNILMLSKELGKSVFGRKQLGYLQEVINAKKDLKVYRREKATTHTSDNTQLAQYLEVLESFNNENEKAEIDEKHINECDLFRSSNVRLLADMNVSSVFRKSLYKKFYQVESEPSKMNWGDSKNILNKGREFLIKSDNLIKRINIVNKGIFSGDSLIHDDDQIYVYDGKENETILLLFSLILNVIEKENNHYRGKFDETNSIDVFISKTQNGNIRIANKIQENDNSIRKARECLQTEPGEEERGISLWSVQAHVRRIVVAISRRLITSIKDEDSHHAILGKIELLTSDKFAINVDITNLDGEEYFWYEIPLLSSRFDEVEQA